ncbi:hypothetical protein FPHOBKDP_00164 [Listeria phage LPJP1]|nr:hypothetical protein FPHOBKDP_00164 [Listeria phage LPJP1]
MFSVKLDVKNNELPKVTSDLRKNNYDFRIINSHDNVKTILVNISLNNSNNVGEMKNKISRINRRTRKKWVVTDEDSNTYTENSERYMEIPYSIEIITENNTNKLVYSLNPAKFLISLSGITEGFIAVRLKSLGIQNYEDLQKYSNELIIAEADKCIEELITNSFYIINNYIDGEYSFNGNIKIEFQKIALNKYTPVDDNRYIIIDNDSHNDLDVDAVGLSSFFAIQVYTTLTELSKESGKEFISSWFDNDKKYQKSFLNIFTKDISDKERFNNIYDPWLSSLENHSLVIDNEKQE